jgi:hypothetical protein
MHVAERHSGLIAGRDLHLKFSPILGLNVGIEYCTLPMVSCSFR